MEQEKGRIRIHPNPDYKLPEAPKTIHVEIHARTYHAREYQKQTGSKNVKIIKPETCPVCMSGKQQIGEIEKEGRWWWHCSACGNDWAPVERTIQNGRE